MKCSIQRVAARTDQKSTATACKSQAICRHPLHRLHIRLCHPSSSEQHAACGMQQAMAFTALASSNQPHLSSLFFTSFNEDLLAVVAAFLLSAGADTSSSSFLSLLWLAF